MCISTITLVASQLAQHEIKGGSASWTYAWLPSERIWYFFPGVSAHLSRGVVVCLLFVCLSHCYFVKMPEAYRLCHAFWSLTTCWTYCYLFRIYAAFSQWDYKVLSVRRRILQHHREQSINPRYFTPGLIVGGYWKERTTEKELSTQAV